ncbi:MAG: murein L,D-transpeptidase catalytic domain family protein [Bacteroidetes bacterium]|nr:murein L,D-transpeptidase catalytic domain family protein [Bacteroidota bacterium]
MKKLLAACAACIILFTSMVAINTDKEIPGKKVTVTKIEPHTDKATVNNYWVDSLYNEIGLEAKGLSRDVFFAACKGYEYMLANNLLAKTGIITICDFSQSSDKKRLYVFDLDEGRLLFNTYVAHGRNSGNDFATSFSNRNESHKSCLGFLRTAETYFGDNGYSMRLDGMEYGFNDNARERSIVMHGSNYVNGSRASAGAMMGRSYGCPAVPAKEAKSIINCIKDGSCFFNYFPDKMYSSTSKIMNADFTWPITASLQLASNTITDSIKTLLSNPGLFN